MTASFFAGCADLDSLKTRYRQLAREHHPDRGGDLRTMQEINAEYEAAFRLIRKGQGIPHEQIDEDFEIERDLMDKVRSISHLDGIAIEVCGRWIWVTGNTFPHKDALKAAAFSWASKKRCWFWRPDDAKCRRSRREITLDEIRQLHGSHRVNPGGSRRMEAA